MKNGKLSFDVRDDHVEFNLFNLLNFFVFLECYRIDVIDNLVREEVVNKVSSEPLEHCVLNDGTVEDVNLRAAMSAQFLEASPEVPITFTKVEESGSDNDPSLDEKHAPQV